VFSVHEIENLAVHDPVDRRSYLVIRDRCTVDGTCAGRIAPIDTRPKNADVGTSIMVDDRQLQGAEAAHKSSKQRTREGVREAPCALDVVARAHHGSTEVAQIIEAAFVGDPITSIADPRVSVIDLYCQCLRHLAIQMREQKTWKKTSDGR
jgi:hypothetical protein